MPALHLHLPSLTLQAPAHGAPKATATVLHWSANSAASCPPVRTKMESLPSSPPPRPLTVKPRRPMRPQAELRWALSPSMDIGPWWTKATRSPRLVDLVHSLSLTKTIHNSGKSQAFYTKALALLAISDLVQILNRNLFSATILHFRPWVPTKFHLYPYLFT
jgi:hypothetical protein